MFCVKNLAKKLRKRYKTFKRIRHANSGYT